MPPEATLSHRLVDRMGVTLAALCMVHCLALPLLASLLPLVAPLADLPGVHGVLVLLAMPLGLLLVRDTFGERALRTIALQALVGLALLVGALALPFVDALEEPMTVTGALLLASAHLRRWLHRRRACP